MKKVLFALLIIFILLINNVQFVHASDQNYYAKIISNNVYLYKTANTNQSYSNVYFEIPNSYFVLLLSDYNENFYKAKYLDQTGYVKKTEVQAVLETPLKPYANNITFRVYSSDGCNMRNEPTTINGNLSIVGSVPTNTNSIQYYGKLEGEESIYERGNIWYYSKYTNGSQTFYGYIYGGLCDLLTSIPANTEEYTFVTNPFIDETSTEFINYLNNDQTIKIILIIAVSLPSIALFYFLFKPLSLKDDAKSAPISKRIKKQKEYLYYDDKEL